MQSSTTLSSPSSSTRSAPRSSTPSYMPGLISRFLRLFVWYSIITALFRCPSSISDLTSDSPRICKPYLNTRTFLTPYVEPYYDTYAAPYVDAARPYADQFHQKVYQPGVTFARSSYDSYGAPRVAQAQAYSQHQWQQAILPRLESSKGAVLHQYQTSLAPYVDKAYAVTDPYLQNVKKSASTQYDTLVLPAYSKVQPYVQNATDQGYYYTTKVIVPYGKYAGETSLVFLQRKIWPSIRIAYGENVQPQLMKIRERLSSYRDGKRLESAMEAMDDQSSTSSLASSTSSLSSKIFASQSGSSSTTAASSSVQPASFVLSSTSASSSPTSITSDLKTWQSKFSKALEKGTSDLRSRISDITTSQISTQAQGTGKALVIQLEETVKSSLEDLKTRINKIISNLSSDDEADNAKEEAHTAIRASGKKIKHEAQKLREWRQTYDKDLSSLVDSATHSTLDVVHGIRDLGLQELGIRWASLEEGVVSYSDWSAYHGIRANTTAWRDEVQNAVSSHRGIKKAKDAGEEVESRGMVVAEDAAKELARLKEVAEWKIKARDASNDFSSRYVPAGAARAGQKAKGKVDEAKAAVGGESSSSKGAAESVKEKAQSVASDASRKVEKVGNYSPSTSLGSDSETIPASDASSGSTKSTSTTTRTISLSKASSSSGTPRNAAESESSSISSKLRSAASQGSEQVDSVTSSLEKSKASASKAAKSEK